MKAFISFFVLAQLLLLFSSSTHVVDNDETLFFTVKGQEHMFRLQHFSKEYPVDSLIPVYQISLNYIHGSITILFNPACEWKGTYSLMIAKANDNYKPTNPPYPNVISRLGSNFISMDLSKLTCANNMQDSITVKLKRKSTVDVDPYNLSVFGFSTNAKEYSLTYETISYSNGGVNDLENEFSFSLNQVLQRGRNYFGFQYWVNSDYHEETNVQIRYPKILHLENNRFSASFQLQFAYNRAPIIDPKLKSSIPIISIDGEFFQVEDKSIPKPFDYILSKSRTSLQNRGLKPLIEEKTLKFHYDERDGLRDSSNNVYFIDPFSLVCAFSYEKDGFSYMKIDELSRVIETKASSFLLECSSSEITGDYMWTVLAKKSERRKKVDCFYNRAYSFSPDTYLSYDLFSQYESDAYLNIWTERNSNFSGTISLKNMFNEDDNHSMDYLPPNTYQKPLTLVHCFQVDFSQLVFQNGLVNFEFKSSSQQNTDPYSTRISILDSQTNSFFLYQQDSPTNSDLKWSIGQGNEKVVFGLWAYVEADSKLGEPVFVNYPRNINYQLQDSLSMNMYFFISITPELYHRPYFVIDHFSPNITWNNYVILQSFEMSYGEGLNSLNFDEGRIFNYFQTTSLFDTKGNKANVKLSDLSCVYIMKDSTSQYSTYEFSDLTPKFDEEESTYQLDCSEDVRDDSFVILLVGKEFERNNVEAVFGSPIIVDSAKIVSFETSWSPLDKFTLSVDVNTVLKGEFTMIEKQLGDFKDYTLQNTLQMPLNILGIFELDYSKVETEMEIVSESLNGIFVKFEKSSSLTNTDPLSFRLFKVNSASKTFDLMFNDQPFSGPWEFIVNGTSTEKTMLFAIAAYQGISGVFNSQYQISYSRQLQFVVDQNELLYSFQLSSQALSTYPSFKMNLNNISPSNQVIIDPITKNEFLKIYSFSVQQNVLSFNVKSSRKFTFSSVDTSLNPLTVTCAYSFNDEEQFYLSTGQTRQENGKYSVNCEEGIMNNEYQLWIIARKIPVPPQPVPSPSIHPEPSSQPTPSPTLSPTPTPLNSFERENGIPLHSGITFTKSINIGQTVLTSIELAYGKKLTISFGSLNGQSMQLLVGTDFKPTSQMFTTAIESNQVVYLNNVQSTSQTIYMLIQGPLKEGPAQFTILPLITNIPIAQSSSNPSNPIIESHDTTPFTVTIIILSLIIVILLLVGLSVGIYVRKQFFIKKQKNREEEKIELVPKNVELNLDQGGHYNYL